jgi:ubiquinone/menaquinone biosynthesis C-methylase UbiE
MKRPHAPHRPKSTGWNEVADWYDNLVGEGGSDYHRNVIIPGSLRLLAPQKGEKVLDVACGQGVFCRELVKSGAEVIGLDSSPALIEAARKHSTPATDIKYVVNDASNMRVFQDNTFDAEACIMAIQNMESLAKPVGEMGRVLKKGGRLLLVMSHPCFRVPKNSNWGFDNRKQLQYRRIDRYMSPLKAPIRMHPGFDPKQVTFTFHRPLTEYFKALQAVGLAVMNLEEWVSHRESKPGGRARAENQSRKEFPLFLALVAVKV